MAAKTTSSSSCFSFLKEALLLPTRNPKLFAPVFLLFFVASMVAPLTNVLCIRPLTADLGRLAAEMKNTDASSAEYARILEEIQRDATKILAAAAALLLVALPLAFVKQILAFSAASTTYSGGRYSLAELLRALTTKGSGALNLKAPCLTIAVVTVLEISYVHGGPGRAALRHDRGVLQIRCDLRGTGSPLRPRVLGLPLPQRRRDGGRRRVGGRRRGLPGLARAPAGVGAHDAGEEEERVHYTTFYSQSHFKKP